nr:ABC transporter permease subunit [uncultured Holophaga sp.]
MITQFLDKVWGQTNALFYPFRRRRYVDLFVVLLGCALLWGLIQVGHQWTGAKRPVVEIDLSVWALPKYTFFSMMRGLAAYLISLGFTLLYAFWAAKDNRAEKLLIPILDILQSIPVLGFMPGLILALGALFPHSNFGLELAAILMIFAGQAWNMTFSLYHSLKSVPNEMQEAGTIFGFTWWQRFKWVELPYGTSGLVWNSMMSMAGGWFFLMITEAFRLGDQDFRLPGLGSYMSVAVEQGNAWAMIAAVVAMVIMIVALDQVIWRPVVVWAQRFRVEETAQAETAHSWLLKLMRRSRLIRWMEHRRAQRRYHPRPRAEKKAPAVSWSLHRWSLHRWFANLALAALLILVVITSYKLVRFMAQVQPAQWWMLFKAGLLTLLRVMASTALGTLWAVPAGLAIGLSPRLSRLLQPVVQVAASFPAPMLFPVALAIMAHLHITLGYGCVVLMLLGTQWYILFNVIAGSMAIPGDLKEAAESFRLPPWQRLWVLYIPAIFPYLVTGWVTAAGGAWNTSIVAEYYALKGNNILSTFGLGSEVSKAAYHKELHLLAAGVLLMSAIVVLFNRFVWKPCYHLAHTRFSLTK